MKPPVLDGSPCWRSRSGIAVILILLVFLPCFSLILFNSLSLAVDDQTTKAVRRSSSDQKRVALVIGNSDYQVGPLRSPAHDAEDIAGVLRTLGFAVQVKTNVNHVEMEEAVNKFVQEIQNGDVALFYFSGHGVQVTGDNYLIPLGSSITSGTDVRFKTLNAGLVLGKMEESRNRTNIVILDACRNNPFKGLFKSPSIGLSKMDAPKGTFIAYATSPGSVAADGTGRNSPYTKHLMEVLKVKDIPIEQVFKQVGKGVNKETGGQQTPWTSSSLLDDFYFYPGDNLRPVPTAVVTPPSEPARPHQASLSTQTPPGPVSVRPSDYRERVKELLVLAATRGDRETTIDLELMFRDAEAVKWFRQAGEQGDAVAQLMLGLMFWEDRPEALKWFRKAAEQGNTWAQYYLQRFYKYGWGVPVDKREALKWFTKAVEQGNALAQYDLGQMYHLGIEVAQDYEEALKWYGKAAEQGNAAAQKSLGDGYRNGSGVAQDYSEAVKWYRKSADQGNAHAQVSLGWMYETGQGVTKDYVEAVKWYRKAADLGNEYAQFELGKMHKYAEDRAEAIEWFKKAAAQGHLGAKEELQKLGVAVK